MFIPMNFAVGIIMGAAAAYIYKDDSAKQALSNTGSKVKNLFKKKPEAIGSAEDASAEVADAVKADVAEAATEIKAEAAEVANDVAASVKP